MIIGPEQLGSVAAFQFLLDCLVIAKSSSHDSWLLGKLVLPCSSGYVLRSDIVPLRMADCPSIESVTSFSDTQHYFSSDHIQTDSFDHFPKAFVAAAAGMIVRNGISMEEAGPQLQFLETELRNRLSFPWILEHPRGVRTVALIGAGRERGGASVRIYPAAKAMGIQLIVLDNPGSWMENSLYSTWREEFIPIDCKLDNALSERIVEAIRKLGRHFDAVVTFIEPYMVATAKAAQELGLPSTNPNAIEIATDKFKTSVAAGQNSTQASSLQEADEVIKASNLDYPLVIKPRQGHSSEGVSLIQDTEDLSTAIEAIIATQDTKEFVIQQYCDGPEVDANFVLHNGEILFFEVSDDFPKGADTNGYTELKTFIEVSNVLPSKLPSYELSLLRKSLHKTLLEIGFKSGILHLEARVNNSAMEYVTKGAITDLEYRKGSGKAAPSAWLIEINPRSPGVQASNAVLSTYGIDYWGLGLVFAIADHELIRALSCPFGSGPQYWSQIIFIPVERGGTFDSDDVCADLIQRHPNLAKNISASLCHFKRGEKIPAPESGKNSWIAYFVIFSRLSRADVLGLGVTIKKEVRFVVV
jgi:hypothetical protein